MRIILFNLFPTFESRVIFVIGAFLITIIINFFARFSWRKAMAFILSHPELKNEIKQEITKEAHEKWFLRILDAVSVFAVIVVIWITVAQRPYVLETFPERSAVLPHPAAQIEIEFDIPINKNNITMHISPEILGKWVWDEGLFSRKVTFIPEQSFYPNDRIIVYIVGLQAPWHMNKSHEESLEFEAPSIPQVISHEPYALASNIRGDLPIKINYDQEIYPNVNIQYKITPDPGQYSVLEKGDLQELVFETPLLQDTIYTIQVFQTPRAYNVVTNEDIELGKTTVVKEWSFSTVETPLLTAYHPKGQSVLPDEEITIEFSDEMDVESVNRGFSIIPNVLGDIAWEGQKMFKYLPTEELSKDTEYIIKFASGLVSQLGGKTQGEIELVFKTIGPVRVEDVVPVTGSAGIDPRSMNIEVLFDQPVEHASAEANFRISPYVSAGFTWDGNKLIYLTSGKLAYATNYQINLMNGIKSIYGLDSNENFQFSFMTRDNTFSLSLPYYRQEHTFTCNIAATRMTLAYRGINLSENEIINGIGKGSNPSSSWVDGYGVHAGPVARYISQYRKIDEKHHWNLTELVQSVQAGNPVIVWVYNRYSQPYGTFTLTGGYTGYMGMHSEVVRGFVGSAEDPVNILTSDPWRGNLKYSRSQFESIWSYLDNTAVVIY